MKKQYFVELCFYYDPNVNYNVKTENYAELCAFNLRKEGGECD